MDFPQHHLSLTVKNGTLNLIEDYLYMPHILGKLLSLALAPVCYGVNRFAHCFQALFASLDQFLMSTSLS